MLERWRGPTSRAVCLECAVTDCSILVRLSSRSEQRARTNDLCSLDGPSVPASIITWIEPYPQSRNSTPSHEPDLDSWIAPKSGSLTACLACLRKNLNTSTLSPDKTRRIGLSQSAG